MNPQMPANKDKLWHAVAFLPDALIEEAEACIPEKTGKTSRRLLLAAAVAAALLLLGCIAHTWLYAPGRGIIPAFTDTGVNIWFTDERVQIGDFTLEAAMFTEDTENPQQNRLMFWWYSEDQKALENWPRIRVNGALYYFSNYRMTANSNLCCYTYTPQTRGLIGPVQDTGERTELEIQLMNADTPYAEYADGEMVRIPLTMAKSGSIRQISLDDDKAVSLLPLTDNVFAGNFHNPAVVIGDDVRSTVIRGEFTLRYADGSTSEIAGLLSMDGKQTRETGVVSDRYDCPLESAVLHSVSIHLDYRAYSSDADAAPVYSFPMMAVGESISCDVPVWAENGLEIRLISVYRDETGLHYSAALQNGIYDPLIADGDAVLLFRTASAEAEDPAADWSESCSSHPDDTGEIVTDLRYLSDGSKTWERTLQEGETIHLLLSSVSWTYANPDGTPFGEIRFDGKG